MPDEEYARIVASVLGLEIAPEHMPGVVANLRRVAQLGAPALDAEIGAEDEPAPVWRP